MQGSSAVYMNLQTPDGESHYAIGHPGYGNGRSRQTHFTDPNTYQ